MEQAISTVYFNIPKQVTILDLSGVLQVFEEARILGFNYHLEFISNQSTIKSSSGLELAALKDFRETNPTRNDIIFISGSSTHQMIHCDEDQSFFDWLKRANSNKTTICSICSGAFLLAKSGLLNNKDCTTHWDFIKRMKTEFPLLKIQDNTLFTKSDDNIYTSAGVVTGIDLALFLIEENASIILNKWREINLPIFHIIHSSKKTNSKFHESQSGFEIKDEVKLIKGESVIKKNVHSAFIGTDLKERLDKQGINSLVIIGMTTNHCVSTSTRMAGDYGFDTILISDATATFDRTGNNGEKFSS